MVKNNYGLFILTPAELEALINASIETATKVMHDPAFDPAVDALPFYVNCGYKHLYDVWLFEDLEL